MAVSISQRTSLTATVSPTATRHSVISASVRPSPTSGRVKISMGASRQSVGVQYAKVRSTASRMRSRSGRYCSSTRDGG
ncbi:hypothetical protein ACFFX0_19505 [Citricoccus parietis]|uniref:Uncharacterized protein n=1 Tax=Citricoccus parietis TaxID=592307 RepID=A0ABV5G3N5_9MICC